MVPAGPAVPAGTSGDILTLHRIRDGRTLALRLGSDAAASAWQTALTARAGGYGVKDVGDFVVRGLASPPPAADAPPPPPGGVALAYDVLDGPTGEALRLSVLPCAAVFAGAATFSATLTTRLCSAGAGEGAAGKGTCPEASHASAPTGAMVLTAAVAAGPLAASRPPTPRAEAHVPAPPTPHRRRP